MAASLPTRTRPSTLERAFTPIFALTICLSAFLLFQIQPMISRFILPWFGGSSAVWTTSMLFFQVLLLGGYAYAHLVTRLAPRGQARLHLLLLLVVLLWSGAVVALRGSAVTPDPSWKPSGGALPVWSILLVLAGSVGIPYFLLSTTSSLAQSWYRELRRKSSPYVFYAVSNAASLLALITYPLLFEPNFTLRQQAVFWSSGFAAYLLLAALCAVLVHSRARNFTDTGEAEVTASEEPGSPSSIEPRPSLGACLLWVLLAATASVMLLATTNHVTQDLSAAPFLWVLPLSLYLLSFVFAFNDRQVRVRGAYVLLALPALLLGYFNLKEASSMPILMQVLSNAALLMVICMLCHTELYARRPHPRYLTVFYLMVSIGGAVGGLFVGLAAPLLFNDFWEYHLGLAAAGVVAVAIAFRLRGEWIHRLRFPVALAAVVLLGFIFSTPIYWLNSSVLMVRNFYGVLRVRPYTVEGQQGYKLMHGGILHGSQVRGQPFSQRPTTYYSETTGVGLAYKQHPKYLAGSPMRAGVVGLGVGTVAAYGRAGDVIRFYEINPQVETLARDTRYFTYLSESQADVAVVLGDARLSMERELARGDPQAYDLLVIDAFSGDSIPTHLLDRESFAVYLRHLAPGGVLAIHISNRHLDLQPVVALLTDEYNQQAALIEGGSADWQGSYSVWALVGSREAILDNPAIASRYRPLRKQPGLRMWTDDYSNLIQVLRR